MLFRNYYGEVSEWSKELVSKISRALALSRVRISPSPKIRFTDFHSRPLMSNVKTDPFAIATATPCLLCPVEFRDQAAPRRLSLAC